MISYEQAVFRAGPKVEIQLFENVSRPEIRAVNKKTERYLITLSVLIHLAALVIWIAFVPTAGVEPVTKSVKVFSDPVYFNYPKPPPPPPRRKSEIKKFEKSVKKPVEHVSPVFPIEPPDEIKPEPPKDQEENLPDNLEGATVPGNGSGEPGETEGGVPGGVSGGVAGQPPIDSPDSSQGPIVIKGDTNHPKRTKYVHPTYPPIAIMARVEGTVIVEAIIGKDGKIKSARVVRSMPLFDEAALEAVKKWEYTPMVLNGEVREVQLTVTINFKLE